MRFINLILFLFLLYYQHNIYIIVNSNIILYVITFFLKDIKKNIDHFISKNIFLGDYLTDKIIVIHSDGKMESFKPRLIGQAIMKETGVSEQLAMKIQKRIANKFYKLKEEGLNEVSTSQIRAEVSAHLLNEGRFTDAEGTLQMGLTRKQVDELLQNHSTENANNNDNSESFYKRVAERTLEEYTFARLPDYISDAHINGYIHLHDRADFFIKPNCVSGNNNVIVKDKDNIVSYIRMDDLVSEFETNDDFYYEVPTLNIEKNIVEWKPIINAWCTGEDEVFKVSFGKGYSIECTNDHKFIKSSSNSPCKDYDIQVKEFDSYKDLRLCNITNIYKYNENNDYYLSALFGFFLGDGHLDNDTGLVKFTFAKKDKVDYIISLLDKLQLNYDKTDYKTDQYTGGYVYHITITDCIYPKLSKEELIKRFKKTLNLKGVLEGLIASDGGLRLDIGNSLKLYFSNTNKAIFDLYHLCLISQGIRGSTHYKKPITYYDNALHCEKTMQKGVYMSSSFGESVIKLVNSITIRKKHEEAIKDFNKNPKKYSVISELQPKSIEYIGEQKVYNLTIQDNHNYMCGINGFVLVQNCFSYSIPWLLQNGFSPDGDRQLGATSSPPKHFDTLMNLMHELLGCGKIDLSGGQNFPHANVYLAPCTTKLSYEELKQSLQSLLFNLNQAIMSKGEVVFTSMGWDLEIPSYMANEDAIGLGGVVVGKYGDYEDEAKRILKIWCELLKEGDSRGVPFRFPNNIFILRDDYKNDIDEQLHWICEYLCKFPTGYFSNDDLPNTGGISTIMGCRTRNTNADSRFSWQENTLNNGNLAFHSLNLPLFALESNNLDEFYDILDKYCNIAIDALFLRRQVIEQRLKDGKLPFLSWTNTFGKSLYEIERTTLSVGFVGLNETIRELTNDQEDITTENGIQLGIDILEHIQGIIDIRKKETGYKLGLFSTPAESTCSRFALINKEKYPQAIVNGKGKDIFYTNSHHIRVSEDVLLTDHLKNAATFHKLTPFGAICHVFLGTKPSVESLIKLTKMIKKHDIGFWSYTLDFTICNTCQQTFLQALDECPNCGSKALTVYSKITGYYVPVYQQDNNGEKHRQWNNGKIGEFNERKKFAL